MVIAFVCILLSTRNQNSTLSHPKERIPFPQKLPSILHLKLFCALRMRSSFRSAQNTFPKTWHISWSFLCRWQPRETIGCAIWFNVQQFAMSFARCIVCAHMCIASDATPWQGTLWIAEKLQSHIAQMPRTRGRFCQKSIKVIE